MPTPFDPSDSENWIGGYYEAAMILGGSGSDQSDAILHAAIESLWASDCLRVAAIGDLSRWQKTEQSLRGCALDGLFRIYGIFDHQELGPLPFTSVVVREGSDGEDWLYACVPMGGLVQSGGFPFGDDEHTAASRCWREPLERRLADLVLNVCETIDIQIAAIGFEIAGIINRDAGGVAEMPRRVGYIAKDGSEYHYWPTTEW